MSRRSNNRLINMQGVHPDAIERQDLRRRDRAVFEHDGVRNHIIYGAPIHYYKNSDWQEIDNRWKNAASPWDYSMIEANYKSFVLKSFTAGQILRLEKGEHHLIFQPMDLNFTNDLEQIQQVASPQNIEGVVINAGSTNLVQSGCINWIEAYGTGLNFSYIPRRESFRKLLSVSTLSALGTPQSYILQGGNPVLQMNFIFSSDLNLWVDGIQWDQLSKVVTTNRIEFKDANENLHWWWGAPSATGNDRDICAAQMQVDKRGNSFYISIHVPWEWLEGAVYPVVIDPDIYYGSTDDGHIIGGPGGYTFAWANSTSYNNTAATFWVGQRLIP